MPKKNQLHVLDVQEEMNGELFYVAQCLEYDVRGIGSTIEEARENFAIEVARLRRYAELEGLENPFFGRPSADKRFWEMLKEYRENGGTAEQPYW
jgi:hypothetical protein